MTATTISLNKQTYPLMMHLSILPKYGAPMEKLIYNPSSQTSDFSGSMKGSWCTQSNSTGGYFGNPSDDDIQEDD